MKDILPPLKTLGTVSARFISELQQSGSSTFTLEKASAVYGKGHHETTKFLCKLIERGIIARIKSGVYIILQMGQESVQLDNWPLIARELAAPNDYFISHYSAMRLHGMTTHPLFDITITTFKRKNVKEVSNITYHTMFERKNIKKKSNMTYHFIYSKPEHFWGSSVHWITNQNKVNVSDLERTLLDGLARPDLCGGIKEIVRGIWVKQKNIDWEKMVTYAERFHTKAAVKRLGFILEVFELGLDYIPSLLRIITTSKGFIFLDPDGMKEGNYLSRWRVRLNINIEELKMGVWE
ncbi:MAG: hypothetical protein JSS53_03485 [Proteobacteria bacterium]|nr:hypothetical protein [Pseudomonadota bacterium]